MKKITKITLVFTTVSTLPLPFVSAACNLDDLNNEKKLIIDTNLNVLGKTMNALEIKERLDLMYESGKSNDEIIKYINLFTVKPINVPIGSTLTYLNSESTGKGDLNLSFKFKQDDGQSETITKKYSNFELYSEKGGESGKINGGIAKVGDLKLNTDVNRNGRKIGAMEFKNKFDKQFDSVNGDATKMLDWMKQYIDIEGDYSQNSKWVYKVHKSTHHHGDGNLHAYISARDRITGRVYRAFDGEGNPGITFLGWNKVKKIGNIFIEKIANVSPEGAKVKANQAAKEINSASSIDEKINIIKKYSMESFEEYFKGDNSQVDYQINAEENNDDINQLHLIFNVKGKIEKDFNIENQTTVTLNRFFTNLKVGDYTFNTVESNFKHYANELLAWIGGNQNGGHPQELKLNDYSDQVMDIFNGEDYSDFNEKSEAAGELIEELVFELQNVWGELDKYKNILTEEEKLSVVKIFNNYDFVKNARIEGTLLKKANEISKLTEADKQKQGIQELAELTKKQLLNGWALCLKMTLSKAEKRAAEYTKDNIKHTILQRMISKSKEMIENQKYSHIDYQNMMVNIDHELDNFKFGDFESLNFEQLVEVMKDNLGYSITKDSTNDNFTYEIDRNENVPKVIDHTNSATEAKDFSVLVITIKVTDKKTGIVEPKTFNIIFKHSEN
ncbi:hypothetical protein KQ874_03345 [Mycoplasma sp. ES3157-GEN-MYC]|uniref:hypothetical protein n=1 Tax=Mycoplasma miroungigenitalium TaxID=754515 RepID=UPI001C104BC3|nr:hypothetical protein [Mycoplasma miroungigenitalium]MBU4690712.1 hypothetical protein [Mycoplasma miroungigenitalium]MBU4691981.1 hypothetical protein [Mycoplasma miroungigenitalium]